MPDFFSPTGQPLGPEEVNRWFAWSLASILGVEPERVVVDLTTIPVDDDWEQNIYVVRLDGRELHDGPEVDAFTGLLRSLGLNCTKRDTIQA